MHYPAKVTVICRYREDSEIAGKIQETVEPDNGDYIRTTVDGNALISVAQSDSILELRSTLDDFLACLFTAEQVIMRK